MCGCVFVCVCLECTKRIRIRFKSKLLWKQTINNKYEKKRAQQRKAETETETEREKEGEERTWTSYNIKRYVCGTVWPVQMTMMMAE